MYITEYNGNIYHFRKFGQYSQNPDNNKCLEINLNSLLVQKFWTFEMNH